MYKFCIPVMILIGQIASVAKSNTQPLNTIKRTFNVASFTGAQISGKLRAKIKIGSAQSIVVETTEDVLEQLDVIVKNGTLHVGRKSGAGWNWPWKNGKTEVTITVPKMTSVDLSGACQLTVQGINSKGFNISTSGAAEATLFGITKFLDVETSGASELHAYQVVAMNVEIDASGASEVSVYAKTTIKSRVSGSAKVSYKGAPAVVKSDLSGLGSIKPNKKTEI